MTTETLQIIPAEIVEAAKLADITTQHSPDLRIISEGQMQKMIESEQVFVKKTAEEIVGMIRFELRNEKFAEIGGIFSAEKGGGKILLDEIIAVLAEKNLPSMLVTRFPENRKMIQLALKKGFLPINPDSGHLAEEMKIASLQALKKDRTDENEVVDTSPRIVFAESKIEGVPLAAAKFLNSIENANIPGSLVHPIRLQLVKIFLAEDLGNVV